MTMLFSSSVVEIYSCTSPVDPEYIYVPIQHTEVPDVYVSASLLEVTSSVARNTKVLSNWSSINPHLLLDVGRQH